MAEIFVDGLAGSILANVLRIILAWCPDLIVHEFDGDHYPSAERLLACEVAQVLPAPEVNIHSVRAQVQHLLTNPGYRKRAREIQADVAATPSPQDVAWVLELRMQTWSRCV